MNKLTVSLISTIIFLSAGVAHADSIPVFRGGLKKEPLALTRSFQKAEITANHRGLPAKVDHSSSMPPVGNQGNQNSCVGWATAYAMKSYQEKNEHNWNYKSSKELFSPAYIYNQINGGRDEGSRFNDAADLVVRQGVATLSTMPYDEGNFLRQPPKEAKKEAANFKGKEWRYIESSEIQQLKAALAGGNVLVGGIPIYENFYEIGSDVFTSGVGQNQGGHAITIVGYDNGKGAFKIMNSWGTRWGDKGYGWISYDFYAQEGFGGILIVDQKSFRPSEAPEAPGNISASNGSYPDRISLSWNSVMGADGYIVYRLDPGATEYTELEQITGTTYLDTGVSPNQTYGYKVASVGENGIGGMSMAANGSAQVNVEEAPTSVFGLNASQGTFADRIEISWDPLQGAKEYKIKRFVNQDYEIIGSTREPHYSDRVSEGESHYYVVMAVYRSGEGPDSEAIGGYTKEREEEAVAEEPVPSNGEGAPETPRDLVASINTVVGQVNVRWATSAGADDYWLYRYDESLGDWEHLTTTKATSFDDRTAESGRSYYYAMVATNARGYSEWSPVVEGVAGLKGQRGLEGPKAVTGLIASQKTLEKRVELKWNASNGSTAYLVFRKAPGKTEKWRQIGKVSATGFTDTAVESDRIYYYKIQTVGDISNGEESSPVVGMAKPEPRIRLAHRGGPAYTDADYIGTWTGSNGENLTATLTVTKDKGRLCFALKVPTKESRECAAYTPGSRKLTAANLFNASLSTDKKYLEFTAEKRMGGKLERFVMVKK